MGDRLATIDMGRKLTGFAPFGWGEMGPNLTRCHHHHYHHHIGLLYSWQNATDYNDVQYTQIKQEL